MPAFAGMTLRVNIFWIASLRSHPWKLVGHFFSPFSAEYVGWA
jgi:hypothetical protein